MLNGCAPTTAVCQNDNNKVERVNLPNSWSMTQPETIAKVDDTQPMGKPELLSAVTTLNIKYQKDRNKLIYLQNYILEIKDKVLLNDSQQKQ